MVKIGQKAATLAGFMAPANLTGEMILRLVRRALDEVTDNAEQRDAILHQALVTAGAHDVPADFREFAEFVFGALRKALEESVGPEDAKVVVDSLESVAGARYQVTPVSIDEEAEAAARTSTTVLVVDDDIAVRSQVVQLLRQRGLNGVSAPDSNVALAMCVRYRPGLLIAAVQPNAERGKQLGALLRVAFGTEAPPMILLAPQGTEPDAATATQASAVVTKPVSEEALFAAIEPLVGAAV